jgi:hypothetical protein
MPSILPSLGGGIEIYHSHGELGDCQHWSVKQGVLGNYVNGASQKC